jgi:hypothetical protein
MTEKGNGEKCLHCKINKLIEEHCTQRKALQPDLSFDEFSEEVMSDLGQVAGDIIRWSREHGSDDEKNLREVLTECMNCRSSGVSSKS